MAVNNFIPQIWHVGFLKALEDAHVFASVASREYEGEIKGGGSRVKINQLGYPTIAPYTKNSTSITPEILQSSQFWLDVNQTPYFAYYLDNIDKVQSNSELLGEASTNSAYSMGESVDQYIAGLYAQAGISQNTNASPANVNSANVEDEILELAEQMDEASMPRNGRFLIIPPWFHTKLVIAGITNETNNTSVYKNGYVGSALGFDYLMSNNVSKNSTSWDKTRIMGGVRGFSLLYAEQLSKITAYEPEAGFTEAVKGLHLYGAKWIPERTAVLYADKTAEA